MRWRGWAAGAVLLLCLPVPRSFAQDADSGLSDREVEVLRDTAPDPLARTQAFTGFLDKRTAELDRLGQGKRKPGREEDMHDQMEQFTSIANDLEDNLEEYEKLHRDLRKVLPKVLAATERWGTALRTPAPDARYDVVRKLALEALADVHETVLKMIDEQKAYFLAHPPPKDDKGRGRG